MAAVLNFGYTNWTKSHCNTHNKHHFQGIHYGYKKKFNITVEREISLSDTNLHIKDTISGMNKTTVIQQIWNSKETFIKKNPFIFISPSSKISSTITGSLQNTYISDYYNSYIKNKQVCFEHKTSHKTIIKTIIEAR